VRGREDRAEMDESNMIEGDENMRIVYFVEPCWIEVRRQFDAVDWPMVQNCRCVLIDEPEGDDGIRGG